MFKKKKIGIPLLDWLDSIQKDNQRIYSISLNILAESRKRLDKVKDKDLIRKIDEFIKTYPELERQEIKIDDTETC